MISSYVFFDLCLHQKIMRKLYLTMSILIIPSLRMQAMAFSFDPTSEQFKHVFWWVVDSLAIFLIVSLIIAVHLSMKDRRQLKQANKKLEEAYLLAEQACNMKASFVQNMSHEVRTPLNAILGFSQLMSLPSSMVSDEEREEYGNYIKSNSEVLMMLFDDIFDLRDLDKGDFKIVKGNVSCNAVCRQAINSVSHRVKADVNIRFTTELLDSDIIYTDKRRVQQILVNYLTNAIKHTDVGEIHVHASQSENPGKITFSVTDNGPGIPPEKAETIFNRFAKIDSFVQGAGIGLNICKMIADRLEAQVMLDTTHKGGARFLLIIDL